MDEFIRQAKAVSDPTRARMLKLLEAGEMCVCDIMDIMGLGQSTASKHLGILKAAGLLSSRKRGTWSYYRLSGGARAGKGFIKFMAAQINDDARIKKDRRLLAKKKPADCKQQ